MNGEREDHELALWVLPVALLAFVAPIAFVAGAIRNEAVRVERDQAAEFEAEMRRDDPRVVGVVFQAVDDVCECERRACADAILDDPELAEAMAELVERQAFERWPHPYYTHERAHIWRAHVSAKLKQGHRCAEAR